MFYIYDIDRETLLPTAKTIAPIAANSVRRERNDPSDEYTDEEYLDLKKKLLMVTIELREKQIRQLDAQNFAHPNVERQQ